MKVLYVSPNGYLGGAERFVCNAAEGHIKSGNIDFEVLFFSEGDASKLCDNLGAKIHILPIKFKMRNLFLVLKVCLYIRSYIKKNNFDIIHSTMPYSQIIIFLSTLFLGIKRVWFQHGPVGGILDKIANLTCVNRIYFNSHYLENEHLKMPLSKRNQKIHKMINYGILETIINSENVDHIKNEFNASSKFLFLSAGRLCPWKGQLELIEAIVILKKKSPEFLEKCLFLIVGSYGRLEDKAYEDEVKEKIVSNELSQYVKMLGHKNNIADYYNACDVFLHTSIIPEPFGLVVAESMKNNCLVIGSNEGGVTDILIDGKTGFTYPSTSKNSQFPLSMTLLKVYNMLDKKNEDIDFIKANAAELINKEYTVNQMTSKLELDYKELNSRL